MTRLALVVSLRRHDAILFSPSAAARIDRLARRPRYNRGMDELCHRCHGVLPQHAPVLRDRARTPGSSRMRCCSVRIAARRRFGCRSTCARWPPTCMPQPSTTGSLAATRSTRAVDWPTALRSAAHHRRWWVPALKLLALAVPPARVAGHPVDRGLLDPEPWGSIMRRAAAGLDGRAHGPAHRRGYRAS